MKINKIILILSLSFLTINKTYSMYDAFKRICINTFNGIMDNDHFIYDYIRNNDINSIKEYIRLGIDVKAINKKFGKPIVYATEENKTDIVKLLLDAGTNFYGINDIDEALLVASEKGNAQIVELLLQADANINIKDSYQQTPLIYAANYGHIEIVKMLINHGLNVNDQDWLNGYINWIDNMGGYTALMLASRHGHTEVAKYLIDIGAQVNIRLEYSALHNAIEGNYKEIVEMLIKAGANFNVNKNTGGRYPEGTPLMVASEKGFKEIFGLIKSGEVKRKEIKEYKELLFNSIKDGNLDNVKEFVKLVTLKIYNENGNNPLHLAIFHNKPEIVKLILSIKPELIQEKNNDGKTPIEINPGFNNYDIIKTILGLNNQNNNEKSKNNKRKRNND